MDQRLKPCPDCGSSAELMESHYLESGKPYSYIFCTNKQCIHHNHNIASHHFSGDDETSNSARAIADWNERTSISLNS
ncbi:Lar family restriction alleviation protein [Keguizhuia sedimenti]|uniref:Lar family restriction alleviation protein n=1 Tax=Keguizhuia sedimenti TaxID=3064264 RepID=UPI003BAF9A08